jgi:hypothetical protein
MIINRISFLMKKQKWRAFFIFPFWEGIGKYWGLNSALNNFRQAFYHLSHGPSPFCPGQLRM